MKANWLLPALMLLSACASSLPDPPAPLQGCAVEPLSVVSVTMQGNEPHVAAAINDWPVRLILDTGAQRTTISAAVANSIRLRHGAQGGMVQVLGGSAPTWPAKPREFTFGGLTIRDQVVQVATVNLPRPGREPPDGLLGADILSRYDLDLDFGNSRVTLLRARQCPDGGPDWNFPYVTLEMLTSPPGRIMVPAELDGVPFAALIDTGAGRTAVAREIALRTGLTDAQLDSGPAGTLRGATNAEVPVRVHRFGRLRLGPLQAEAPVLLVAPLPQNFANGILGMDFLRGRRVWVSYASKRVFVGLAPRTVADTAR